MHVGVPGRRQRARIRVGITVLFLPLPRTKSKPANETLLVRPRGFTIGVLVVRAARMEPRAPAPAPHAVVLLGESGERVPGIRTERANRVVSHDAHYGSANDNGSKYPPVADAEGIQVLATSDVIAFASTTDLTRARMFYETVLELPVLEANTYACVFDANGTMLRVTAVAEVANPGYTVLGWCVADIGETVSRLESRGVAFERYDHMEQDTQGVWTTPNGDRIAWFTDPDGNVLSLTEFS
jgi:predicted enzyme related to lactoylglutathione lyase